MLWKVLRFTNEMNALNSNFQRAISLNPSIAADLTCAVNSSLCFAFWLSLCSHPTPSCWQLPALPSSCHAQTTRYHWNSE